MRRTFALLLLIASAASAIPCVPYPNDPNIPDDQESCIVQWGPDSPVGSSPLNLSTYAGALQVTVCYLEEPALNCTDCVWCPERSGVKTISLRAWCNRLRVLPLPAGGTEAMRAPIVTDLCSRNGA